ncbi:glucose-6-phosphate isomerase [Cryobacterium glaciale]|uniref:glucose-6-phosphate isomerase n=1 Tax=Cryobacterium glaciale TaxID=1259145 RepID=A0A4R8V159_9MICO|nr:glucose-6-phosphate isomerase family protein [Cryobacterium glaciale]TFB74993.1 glucose-6-phosphate isomerase [Cryobacterium glaciale]
MTHPTQTVADSPVPRTEPVGLTPVALFGRLIGANARYEKFLSDLSGVYQDEAAHRAALTEDSGEPVYWVESSAIDQGSGALTIGVSTIKAGQIGDEYAMTRGHIHKQHSAAELYFGLSGRGVMLMETMDGESRAIEITPGVAVHVPGHWIHRSVNVGPGPFTTLFCYPTDAGQDYGIIRDAGGMKKLVVTDGNGGWALRDNPAHRSYAPDANPQRQARQ